MEGPLRQGQLCAEDCCTLLRAVATQRWQPPVELMDRLLGQVQVSGSVGKGGRQRVGKGEQVCRQGAVSNLNGSSDAVQGWAGAYVWGGHASWGGGEERACQQRALVGRQAKSEDC